MGYNKKITLKQIDKLILIVLLILLVLVNYKYLDGTFSKFISGKEQVHVERIIDGDTIETNIGNVRLLGINTPERGEKYYEEAKKYLNDLLFNKTVELEYGIEKKDKYGRILAYIFYSENNINLQIVENGYANYYFPSGPDKHYKEFILAWEKCLNKQVNLCQPSKNKCASCIEITNYSLLKNSCAYSCNLTGWQIKPQARQNILFEELILIPGQQIEFNLNFTSYNDLLLFRDNEGKLVYWKLFNLNSNP